jgi:carbon-monoxide dehydrogenase large subunit
MTQTAIPIPAGLERRIEDYELITGHSHYVDDLRASSGRPPMLHMVAVRSPYAHAKILSLNLEAAKALPGVIGTFASSELVSDMPSLASFPAPGLKKAERKALALNKVRYVGDPVAVVLAENPYVALDARDLVEVEYEPLPAISDPEAAFDSRAPLLYEELGTNIAFHVPVKGGNIEQAFAQADTIVRLRIVNQRVAASSLEPRACMFDFDTTSGHLQAWVSSQAVFRVRDLLAFYLKLDPAKISVHNASVGGGFGTKTMFVGEEIIAALLAVRLGRPVKWIEDRSENLQAQTHGRGQINYIEAACTSKGRLLGIRVRTVADLGAFLAGATAMVPNGTPRMLNGPYQIQAVDSEVIGVYTNKVPTSAYRGAGRPEAAYILERTMDRIAHELHIDPVEVRHRNFLPPDVFPYHTVTDMQYDSGNYRAALDKAVELTRYKQWREEQRKRRATSDGHLLGIGIGSFIETTGGRMGPPGTPQEAATVRIRSNGSVLVQSGVAHNGQGHFTAFTQIVADVLKLPIAQIEVQMNDSTLPAFGLGTFGSRTTQTAAPAVLLAAQAVREKALNLAASLLEAAPDDLELADGKFSVRGVPARSVTLAMLAQMVEEKPELIEHEAPNPANGAPIEGLAAWRDFSPPGSAFSSGTHTAVVEVDSDTGNVRILQYVAVDDGGRILNDYLAEAQVHGALAQGIGQALYEEVVYDEEGQLITSTLMDYALPIATQLPTFITANVETPSPTNPLGAKGVGEAGCIAAPPTIVNAVLDALAPLGISAIDMPLKPEKLWMLIQQAHQGTLKPPKVTPPSVFSTDKAASNSGRVEFA